MERQVHSTEKKWGVWEQLLCKWGVFIHGSGQGVENRNEPARHPGHPHAAHRIYNWIIDSIAFVPGLLILCRIVVVMSLPPCMQKPHAMSKPSSPEVKESAHTRYVLRLEDLEDAVSGRKIGNLREGITPNW